MDFQQEPTGFQSPGARCARHPESPAATICSRCGSYACAQCHRVALDGMDYCFACVPQVEALASRGERFVANLVDQFLILIPWFGGAILGGILSGRHGGEGVVAGLLMVLGFLGSLAMAGYQIYLVSIRGQSIGKRMQSIRVVRTDGSTASVSRILFLRNVLPLFIGSFCGLFGLIDALLIFGDRRLCLHDMLADTKVVKVSNLDTGDL